MEKALALVKQISAETARQLSYTWLRACPLRDIVGAMCQFMPLGTHFYVFPF